MTVHAGLEFEHHRRAIEGLAYRMLGSHADAEDIAQETWLRWNRVDQATVGQPRSWFLKTASRLALDRLKSARRHREEYVGPWLPDPWLVEDRSPADELLLDESITLAMMVAMDQLSAAERAAFILHDVFDFGYDEIAGILGKGETACRQLASRARRALRSRPARFVTDQNVHRELLKAFARACAEGDMESLKSLLRADVSVTSDSGGKALAARKILRTDDIAARLFIGFFGKAKRRGRELKTTFIQMNGLPGLVFRDDAGIVSAVGIAIEGTRISRIFLHRNPDKLARIDNGK